VAIGTGATVDASLLLPLSRWGAVADPTLLPIGALLLPSNRLLLLLFGFGRVRAGGGGDPRALRLGLLRVSSAAAAAVAAAAALRAVVMGAARFRASIPSCNSCLARWPRSTLCTNVSAESISDLCCWKNFDRAFSEALTTFACIATAASDVAVNVWSSPFPPTVDSWSASRTVGAWLIIESVGLGGRGCRCCWSCWSDSMLPMLELVMLRFRGEDLIGDVLRWWTEGGAGCALFMYDLIGEVAVLE